MHSGSYWHNMTNSSNDAVRCGTEFRGWLVLVLRDILDPDIGSQSTVRDIKS